MRGDERGVELPVIAIASADAPQIPGNRLMASEDKIINA
jgi:hypothetical protein